MGNILVNVSVYQGLSILHFTDELGVIGNISFNSEALTTAWQNWLSLNALASEAEVAGTFITASIDGKGFFISNKPGRVSPEDMSLFLSSQVDATTYVYGNDVMPNNLIINTTFDSNGDQTAFNRKELKDVYFKAGQMIDWFQANGWTSEGTIGTLHVLLKGEG